MHGDLSVAVIRFDWAGALTLVPFLALQITLALAIWRYCTRTLSRLKG